MRIHKYLKPLKSHLCKKSFLHSLYCQQWPRLHAHQYTDDYQQSFYWNNITSKKLFIPRRWHQNASINITLSICYVSCDVKHPRVFRSPLIFEVSTTVALVLWTFFYISWVKKNFCYIFLLSQRETLAVAECASICQIKSVISHMRTSISWQNVGYGIYKN